MLVPTMVYVQALPALVEVASEDQLTQVILPALLARAEDPVPNVKFNVCKVLEVRPMHLSSQPVSHNA